MNDPRKFRGDPLIPLCNALFYESEVKNIEASFFLVGMLYHGLGTKGLTF